MRKTAVMAGVLILTAMVLFASDAKAFTMNLWDAFPDTQGQNNLYAYAYDLYDQYPDYGDYRLLSDNGAYSFITPTSSWSIPYLTRDSVSPWIKTHPASVSGAGTNEDAVLGYRSSESSTYNLSGAFAMLDIGSVRVYLKKNDSEIWSSIISNYGSVDFDYNVYLASGDMLYFGISANGMDAYDSSQFRGVISSSSVPEPSCLFLLGFGFLGLLFKKRSNKVMKGQVSVHIDG